MYYKAGHIARAKEVALNNDHTFHLAAILYRKRKLVRIGTNSEKTHPRFVRVYKNGDIGSHLHAEMDVLRFAKPGDIISVFRWSSEGELTMSKPCEHCERFMKEAGIEYVIYSDWDGDFQVMRLN